MDPNRTIRAPSTIVKSSRVNTYNGPLAQTKFRILNPAGLNSAQRQPYPYQSSQNPILATAAATTTTAATATTSRLPMKSSGLIKPTPVRHIISAASSTSIKQPAQSSSRLSSSGSKLATLKLQTVKSATVRKSTALNSKPSSIITASQSSLSAAESASSANCSSTSSEKQVFASIFNSVTGDVGEIRRLLEQLLTVVKAPTNDANQETLVEENERLRKEVAELKDKIRAIKSTVGNNRDSTTIFEESDNFRTSSRDTRPTGSNIFYTPMN